MPEMSSSGEGWAIDRRRHRAILALAYSSGLRVSEIARLRIGDVDFDRSVLLIRGGKGRKDRYTILSNAVGALISTYRDLYRPSLDFSQQYRLWQQVVDQVRQGVRNPG